MHILVSFFRRYPIQSILMLFAMLVAALAEGIGLSAMLPLLTTAIGNGGGGGDSASPAAERIVREGLEMLGIPPTLEVLMLVILNSSRKF